MKIELDVPDNFHEFPLAERQEQILVCLREFGKLLNEHGRIPTSEYITDLLIATGLFAGFCVQDQKDMEPTKIEVTCPRILKEMIKTLGEYTHEGIKQKLEMRHKLMAVPPRGNG